MKIKLLSFFACAFFIGLNSQVAFEQNIVIDSTYGAINPRAIGTADIDNDGFKDLLISGYSDVVWARSIDGLGNFETVRPISTQFEEGSVIAAADFDGDNDMDVVYLGRSDNSSYDVLYAENTDGFGTFSQPMPLANTESLIRLHLQVLDMDNDGDIDIAYSSNEDISWLENTDGLGTFTDHYLLGTNDGFYTIDLDGDNISDIIADFGYDLRAYKLNADGTLGFFETMNTFSLNNDHKAGDIDGDGDNDVVTFFENGNTRQIHWYENTDGLGTFANRQILFSMPTVFGSSSGDQKGLEIIDIDGDNNLDIVTFDSRRKGMSWYKNLGSAAFGTEQIVSDQIPSITSITVSDIDNDNAPDIVFTDYGLNEYSWFKNEDGLGNFGSKLRISSYAQYVNHVDYGDIDGDGDLDLVSTSHTDNKVAWYENTDGEGDFSNIQQLISTTIENPRDIFAVDMDGDMDKDVLMISYLDSTTDDYQLVWLENDGTGIFTTEHIFETTSEAILGINYADVDNDGDMDVISGQEDSVLALYKNNGDGTFAPQVIFSETGFNYLSSLIVADIDGDNDIDVLASYISSEIIWHENIDGLGDLSVKHVIIDNISSYSSIFAADLDGDNDKDLLFTNTNSDEVGYFLNEDGLGAFGPKVVTSQIPQNPSAIYSLDIDNDGDMDMITNSSEGQKFIWFPNEGNANFGNPVEISSFIARINHITSADINSDGKIDLITSSYEDDKVAWFKNLGAFTNTFSGVVRLDANADGCNAADAALPNILVTTDNGTNSFATFTQGDGSYTLQANQNNYTTFISSELPNYYISNPASHTFDFTGLSHTNSNADFCIEANQLVDDVSITVYPTINEPRPGFDTTYRLVYKNNGSTTMSGSIDFQFDDSKISFSSASEAIAAQTVNTLTFNYANLIPFETRIIDIEFDVFTIPTINIGDTLNGTTTISIVGTDVMPDDNTFTLGLTVIGAYDPNDIRVLEGEEITIDEAGAFLHYIIRFQNTGTASAINVRVNNILDNKFDWSTLQLESLSHTGRVEITDGNKVNFIFDNINLPDSTNDEPNSNGFIAYKIKPKSDVVIGDVFSNTADIYFDFNPPITTNTATTEIVNPLSVSDFETSAIQLYPNPVSSSLTIKARLQIDLIRIYDLNGRLLSVLNQNTKTVTLEVSDLIDGLYFVEVKSKNSIQTFKFIKK